jgi:hypothetical protein
MEEAVAEEGCRAELYRELLSHLGETERPARDRRARRPPA